MSQARYLLAILSFLVYQVNSAPIATTTTAQADIPTTTTPHTCTVSVPFRKTLLHDLGCIQDAFRQLTQEITSLTYSSHDYSALDQPVRFWSVMHSIVVNACVRLGGMHNRYAIHY